MCNMKRISYFFASVALVFGAMGMAAAQETVANEDSSVSDNRIIYTDRQSSFRGDFFIGIGGGGDIYFGEHDRQMKLKHRIAPAMDVYVGMWVNSWFGARIAYTGGRAFGLTNADTGKMFSTGNVYSNPPGDSKGLFWQEFDFFSVRADAMFDLINVFAEDNNEKIYTLCPFVGVGVAKQYASPDATKVALAVGLYNAFRISDSFDIVVDVHGTAVPEGFEHETGVRPGKKENGLYSFDGILTASLGIAYTF